MNNELNFIEINQNNNHILYYLEGTNKYFICRPILDEYKMPKNIRNLNKPNFSYYSSISSINITGADDERVNGFPSESVKFNYDKSGEYDSEVIIFDNGITKSSAMLVQKALSDSYGDFNSLYEAISELENIFGIVWKTKKNMQLGYIGELLLIKKYENNKKIFDKLIEGFHYEPDGSRSYNSTNDFEIRSDNGESIFIEVKTTAREDTLFKIKNSQVNDKINDYYVAVKINKIKRGGHTIIDLIDWYTSLKNIPSTFKKTFLEIKNTCDTRKLIRFDPLDVLVKFIPIKNMPKIENYNSLIKNIEFNVDILALESIDFESLF